MKSIMILIVLLVLQTSRGENLGVWHQNCELGKGFDIRKGCTPFFTDDLLETKTEQMNLTKSMGEKIQSSSDYSRAVGNSESVSFGGWGASVSQSSKYMTSSEYSSNSITFQIGSIVVQNRTLIKDVRQMKLNAAASTMLSTNPKEFLEVYGHNFVVGYQTSSSFFGACSVHSSFKKSMDELSLAFSVGYSDVFSVKGSEEFSKTVTKESKYSSVSCSQQSDGSAIVPFDFDGLTGANISAAYEVWQQNLQPYKDTVIYDSWMNIDEVAAQVVKMDEEDRAMFTQFQVSQTLLDRLSTEFANLKYLYNTLSQYSLSECLDADVKDKVHTMSEQLFSLLMDYDLIDELTLANLEKDSSAQQHYFQFFSLWNDYLVFSDKLCKEPLLDCVTDVYVVQVKDANMRFAYTPEGYTLIDQDASQGAGGLYEYVAYKMGKSNQDIINDLQPCCEKMKPSNWPHAQGTEDGDLNNGAGGCYEYLYFLKDKGDICISHLSLGVGKDFKAPPGYSIFGKDLSDSAGGKYIYLYGKRTILNRPQQSAFLRL